MNASACPPAPDNACKILDRIASADDLHTVTTELPDGTAEILVLPGVPEIGAAHAALFGAARRVDPGQILVAGPGATATALWSARSGTEVVYWTDNAAEAYALTATFELHDLAPPRCYLQATFEGMPEGCCKMAMLHVPRGRTLQEELLGLAAAMLHPGRRLVFVGATKEGIKSAVRMAQERFGNAGVVQKKGGYHAALAQRPVGNFPLPEVPFSERTIAVDEMPTRLVSLPGAFADDRLDVGAEALIAGMQVDPGARTLDLGCGTGLVGLAAIRRGAEVHLTDVSARAVASARRTLAANGFPDAPVCLSHGATVFDTGAFDAVVTNPPFHQGHGIDFDVARLFIRDAARVLRPGGQLYLVANRFLKYGPWIEEHFEDVGVAWEDDRFRVWGGKAKRRRK